MNGRLSWRHTMILAAAFGLVGLWGCESTTAPEPSFSEQSPIVPLPRDGGDGADTGGGGTEASEPLRKERVE